MTRSIDRSARGVATPGTTVRSVHPSMGPDSVESHYDEALAVPGLLAEIATGEGMGCDGYLIACFGDPGPDAARELARGPVLKLEQGPEAFTMIAQACRAALELDGSDSVVLGCAGMSELRARLTDELEVPVVDGVAVGVLLVQSLITLGLRAGDRGEFAAPPPKPYTGLLSGFGTS
ncbi:MAG TPA: aspartate/glutamate racemase family protein [Pseudonocardia sp.]